MYTCLYMSICMGVCTCVECRYGSCTVHVKVRRQPWSLDLTFYLAGDRVSLFFLLITSDMRDSGPLLFLPLASPQEYWHYTHLHYFARLYMSSGDLNSGLHPWATKTLPTEPFPRPWFYDFHSASQLLLFPVCGLFILIRWMGVQI